MINATPLRPSLPENEAVAFDVSRELAFRVPFVWNMKLADKGATKILLVAA